MPRPTRCVYKERGQRCRRNGTGDPPLCRAHLIAAQEDARAASEVPFGTFGQGIASAIHDLKNGKLRPESVDAALADAFMFFASMGMGGTPWEGAPRTGPGPRSSRPPPMPGPDPAALARARARQVMGFAPNEAVTVEMVKARKRELAKVHHPDAGGDPSKMAAVNHAADVLLDSCKIGA